MGVGISSVVASLACGLLFQREIRINFSKFESVLFCLREIDDLSVLLNTTMQTQIFSFQIYTITDKMK